MLAEYTEISTWVSLALGGIVGCLATWFLSFLIARVPFKMIGGNPGKQLWSVIFMIPVPFLILLGGNPLGFIIALVWLTVAPSVGVQTVFPPSRPIPVAQLYAGNGFFAIVALLVYVFVKQITG